MLMRERCVDEALLEAVQERFEAKMSVRVSGVRLDEARRVIDIQLALPEWADRDLRHDVLEVLSQFERSIDHAYIISPTFRNDEHDD